VPGEERPSWAAPDSWVETVQQDLPTKEGGTQKGAVSRYFVEHPEMVLGEHGLLRPALARPHRGQSDGRDLTKALAEAMDRLPEERCAPKAPQAASATTDFDVEEAKNGSYYLKDGELYQKQGGVGRKVETKGKGSKTGLTEQAQAVVRGLIPIRDHLRRVYSHDLAAAQAKDPTLAKKAAEAARRDLNEAYDEFVAKHGPINKGIFTRAGRTASRSRAPACAPARKPEPRATSGTTAASTRPTSATAAPASPTSPASAPT
jgi:N12 class adenine-specific DNA methylase